MTVLLQRSLFLLTQGEQREHAADAQTDSGFQLRVDNARLVRTEASLRAKGKSSEEALQALEARLSEYEAEAIATQAALEQGKRQARLVLRAADVLL